MSFPPLNTIECTSDSQKATNRQILMSIEPTSRCNFTPVCGDNCILAATHKMAGKPLAPSAVESLIDEVLNESVHEHIRHIMLVAKEPTESPEHVLRLAKGWHKMRSNQRAISIGMISASYKGIESLIPSLIGNPLSSVLISIDTQGSGLRAPANNKHLLMAALKARSMGAIEKIGVNTTVKIQDLKDVLVIGRSVLEAEVDQWTLAGFCVQNQGLMDSVLTQSDYEKLIDFVIRNFSGKGMRVTIDLPYRYFGLYGAVQEDRWRTEHEIAHDVFVQTLNPKPGFFARVRWDGEILGLEDALRVGTRGGTYGKYHRGKIANVMDEICHERFTSLPC